MRSRNSPKCSKLYMLTFNRLMLKPPTITESEFPSRFLAKIGSSSLVNWSMVILLLWSFGGLYILPSFISLLWTLPLMETKRLSHIADLFSMSITEAFILASTYVMRPPWALHRFPWAKQWYPSSCNKSRFEFSSNQLSWIHIAWSLIFCFWKDSMSICRLSNFAFRLCAFRLEILRLLLTDFNSPGIRDKEWYNEGWIIHISPSSFGGSTTFSSFNKSTFP